jgi:hypothetical protein
MNFGHSFGLYIISPFFTLLDPIKLPRKEVEIILNKPVNINVQKPKIFHVL